MNVLKRYFKCLREEKFDCGDEKLSNECDSEIQTKASHRGEWSSQLEFLLSSLSYAVGLGNLWRFPYLCYENGGGAFIIPYILMLIFAGIPLFFLEVSFGQYGRSGVITIWRISPLFRGIGWAMFLVSSFISIYYNVVIAWALFYLYSSLGSDVPWRHCNNHWNTVACGVENFLSLKNCTENLKGLWYNNTCFTRQDIGNDTFKHMRDWTNVSTTASQANFTYPSDEFFHRYVLDISEGFHGMGEINWKLAIALLMAWALVGICLVKGIQSAGKVSYFTAIFPYIILIVLLGRGLTLDGSIEGIKFYLTPQWYRLRHAKVWGDAAVQIFFSLSPCWGGLITLASYNKKENNCLKDALFVSIGNCLTSLFAGLVIFSIIGFMANEMGLEISKVVKGGAGLAFIVYPEAIAKLPIAPFWSIIFFLMLLTLGLGTQFTVVNTIHTTLLDVFSDSLRKGKRPAFVIFGICIVGYLFGLSCTTRAGVYVLQLIDNYAATYGVLLIGLLECTVISYIFGIDNFCKKLKEMKLQGTLIFKYSWKYVTPCLLVFVIVFAWLDYQPSEYGDYQFPPLADALGWTLSMTSVSAIPIYMLYIIAKNPYKTDSLRERIKKLIQPEEPWSIAEKNKVVNFSDGDHDTKTDALLRNF